MSPHYACLAIETSTEACSIALEVDGHVHARHAVAPRQHAELALPWAQALCEAAGFSRAQLTHIAVGVGPGAFTGVRLAVALAQGLAFARDLPVIPVSTLQCVAAGLALGEGETVCVAMDARMQEVYAGRFAFRGGVPLPLGSAQVVAPEAVVVDASDHCAGTGFGAYADRFTQITPLQRARMAGEALPDARDLLRLARFAFERGETVPAAQIEPLYLRNNVAMTIAEREAQARS